MRLPSLFTKLGSLKRADPALRFAVDRTLIFDTGKTRALRTLLEHPRKRRAESWREAFFDAAWNAALVVANPAVMTTADGYPYVRVNLPPATRFKSASIANMASICLERATGIALFASADDPASAAQFLFPPGMLDSLIRFDTWAGDPADARAEFAKDVPQTLLEPPPVDYLPTYTARAFMTAMRTSWGVADPRVHLRSDPARRHRTLVIGRKLSEMSTAAPWPAQERRLLWLLPQGRSVAPMPEDWGLDDMALLEELAGLAPSKLG